ncbi:MAG: LysM peptidoglycan-binding domain-containing protein [Gammaproteobacteria bacterium]
MPRILLTLLILISTFVLTPVQATANNPFPMPKSLEPAVDFWTKVYTEVDDKAGYIHDNRQLNIIYGTIRFPADSSRRDQQARLKKAVRHWQAVLKSMAAGKRGKYPDSERQVLAVWGKNVSTSKLREAAKRVRFQRGQSNKFKAGVIRSGAYVQYIGDVFRKEGLPPELGVTLPHVESSFTPTAQSHVGAAGLWQFTRSTGRRFMRIDHVVDERLDPFRATHAAAKLLGHNHSVIKHWPLAITAYNHGLAGMRRAVRATGSTDIGVIVQKYNGRLFGFASRNFYAAFLAAKRVSSNPKAYFGELKKHTPSHAPLVSVPAYLSVDDISRGLGIDKTELKKLNPALRAAVWRGEKFVPKGFNLRLPPKSSRQQAEGRIIKLADVRGFDRQKPDRFYRVRRGDSLGAIARRYNTSVGDLMVLNQLRSKNRIYVGQKLRLPGAAKAAPTRLASAAAVVATPPTLNEDGSYRVRPGDTLSAIARRFRASESAIASANGLSNRHSIRVGQRLTIPGSASTVLAKVDMAKLDAKDKKTDVPIPSIAKAGAAVGTAASEEKAKAETPKVLKVAKVVPEEEIPAPIDQPEREPEAETELPDVEPDGPVETQADLSADPADYRVGKGGRIEVQAAETLGHYAEWLKIRAWDIRTLNGLRYGQSLSIGKRIKLSFKRVDREAFEQQRIAYHRDMQSNYFETHRIAGTLSHKLRPGESLWALASNRYRVPLWLLRQYNPDMDLNAVLPPGAELQIPVVETISASG